MPTNRITRSSSLLEALRALALQRASETQRNAQTSQADPGDNRPAVAPRHDVQALRKQLKELAAQTDLSDTQTMLRVREHALREILLWEFGSDFRTDPEFLPMVDAINKALDEAPQYQQQFIDLMTDLRKT
jgi:hypothetical protein